MTAPRPLALLITGALLLLAAVPATGWDGGDDEEPIGVPFEPPPFELPSDLPSSGPFDAPPGIYAVTDAYAGDYVVRDGAVTTYGTATLHGPTDSYARVIDTVATGTGSVFDGSAFNGRSALSDGRPVAGTYYESFVLTDDGYVSLGTVFFQDDAETARSLRTLPPSTPPTTPPAPSPGPVAVPSGSAPAPSSPVPALPPQPSAAPVGTVVPQIEVPGRAPVPMPPAVTSSPELLAGRPIEVLRGRRIEIWLTGLPPGAFWRAGSGEATALGSREGTADEPFVARWDRLAAPGATWPLMFEITGTGIPSRMIVIDVTVRSPGLVE